MLSVTRLNTFMSPPNSESMPPTPAIKREKMASDGSPMVSDTTVSRLSTYSTRVPETVAK